MGANRNKRDETFFFLLAAGHEVVKFPLLMMVMT